ncbi:MAG: 3-dehydroquinate synthase [Oscillospiraceae bacterium]|nr:3-dehydroquinate synthase [Oscillospiraceae bacterium]
MASVIHVETNKKYDVEVGAGLLLTCGDKIKAITGTCRAAIITDSNVSKLYLNKVEKSLEQAGFNTDSFVFKAGEGSKNIETLSDILEFLAENNYTRTDILVALGGGVVGDITGFAASVYLRGVRFVQLPTTLLAMVDSSVGGKTAVDLKAGKNLAGAFYQPEVVLADTETLKTLNRQELANGFAESIKYGVLFDKKLFDLFDCDLDDEKLERAISECIAHKARVVKNDEFDLGERKLLNLGHTIGHAIEKCSGYATPHGHAVAAGMAMIARASEKMGLAEAGTSEKIEKMLLRYNLPVDCDIYEDKELYFTSLGDKKREGGSITLVIPEKIGGSVLRKEAVADLEKYITLGKKGN